MPTALTWQLEGEDTSLTTTVEGAGAAIQKWATESVAAADRVYAAMQKANGGPTTSGSAGLGAVPAQAQAAADALGKVSAGYTASGAAATIATQSQANLTVAMQAVVDAAIKGEGALGAQAAVLTTLSTAESQLAAATLALQRAEETRDAQLTKLSASEAKYQETIAKAVEANKSADTAEAGLARTQAARETAVARVSAAEENYVLALNRVQLAQEKAAASAAALVEKEAASAAAVTTQTAAVGRLAEGMDVYMPWVAQAVEKTGAWEQANARFDEGLTQVRADEEAATTKTKELGDASEQAGTKADRAGQGFDRLTQHIGNLLINQAVYAGLNELQKGLSAVNTLLFVDPRVQEDALATYTVELGNVAAATQRWKDVQAESLKVGLPIQELTTLDQHLAQLGITAQTAQSRFGTSLPQIRKDLEDLASVPGMDISKVDEFFTRGAEGANRLVLSLASAGLASKPELEAIGVQFSGLSNNIISTTNVTTSALLTLIQGKFAGLAAAHAQTMDGIEVTTANAWQKIGQDLGLPMLDQTEIKAKALRDTLTDPAMDEAAKRLGKDLGVVSSVLQDAEKSAIQLVALGPMMGQLIQQRTGVDVSQFNIFNDVLMQIRQSLGDTGPDVQRFQLNEKLLADTIAGNTAGIQDDVVALAKLDAAQAKTGDSATGLGSAEHDAAAGMDTTKLSADQLTGALSRARLAVSDLQAEEAGLVAPLQAALDANNQTAAKVAQNYADQSAGLTQQLANVRAQASAASAEAQAQIDPLQADLQRLSDASAALKLKYDALIQPLKDQETALDRVYQKTQDLNRVNDTKHKLAVDRLLAVDLFSAEGRAAAARLPGDEASASDAQAQQTHDTTKAGLEDQVTGLERAQAKEAANIAAQQRGDQDHIASIQEADKIAQAGYKAQEATIQGNIDKVKAYADQSKEYYDGIKKDLQGQIDSIAARYKALEDGFTAEERTIERAQAVLKDGADAAMQVTQQNANLVLETIQATVAAINVFNGHDDSRPPPAPAPKAGSVGAGSLVQSAPGRPGPGPDFGPINPPGRAGGGPVDTGWYTVGEQGPELLHAGGSGSVSANGGGQDVHFVLEDPTGKVWFETTWARNESFVRRRVTAMLR